MQHDPLEQSPCKPLLIYDGDCAFCRRCVEYGRNLTGDAVDYRPYQQVAAQFPYIPIEQFRAAAQFVDRDGSVSSGAEAVFRALAHAPGYGWLLWLYRHSGHFAALSEAAYRWVARHRDDLYRLLGLQRKPPGGDSPG